ncbi:MAG: Ig-like domain-containing protein [Actinomycetota bacterium]|nr:Ig-like domain-containing protein [Actinomycetota bacterium]
MKKAAIIALIAFMGVILLSGQVFALDDGTPTVTSTNPSNGETGVSVATNITATFSKDMSATTINKDTFTLKRDSITVEGQVTYDQGTRKATFSPNESLAFLTTYTATLTTGVMDASGTPLAKEVTWSFTTEATPTTTTTTTKVATETPSGVLPKTGGFPIYLFVGLGIGGVALGLTALRRINQH